MTSKTKTRNRPVSHSEDRSADQNPKTNPHAESNQIKDPDEWVTGQEPMTGAQASYLKTLSEQVHKPEAFDARLDKAEASKRIEDLKKALP